jgi:hypothetical protein
MHAEAYRYIGRLRQYPNVTRIAVYSNGTIIPSPRNRDALMHDDVYLRISDYGPLSKNLPEITKLFDASGITYSVQTIDRWQDCAHIFHRNRTPAELQEIYRSCCAQRTLTILKGRIYICPFAANAYNLGALPPCPQDSISLEPPATTLDLRSRLFEMLREKTFFASCTYCAGRPLLDASLPAAIQASGPLSYTSCSRGGG